ncbi:formin-like protein 7 isoform X1 [Xiphophorus couchianus]|uniref:formin-like protein 7 isoform X1 n=1 Tax=Xiphophorus couchianus TaxID=32473 RepID=UPI0010162DF5|nr:formin-like protein 7 isoform X1 [Xiphophorus couchianus]
MSDFESDIPPGSPVASREDPAPPSSSPVRRSSRLAMRPDHLSPASFLKSKGVSLAAGLQSPQVASLAALMPFIDTSPPYIPPSPPAPPSSVSGKRSCKSVAPPAKRRKGRPPSSQLSSCLPGPPSAPPPNPNPPPNAPVVPPEAPGPSSGPHSLPPLPPSSDQVLASSLVASMDSLQRSLSVLSYQLQHGASNIAVASSIPFSAAPVAPPPSLQPPPTVFTLANARPAPPSGAAYTPLHANISPRLRSKILQGQYINLASILLPSPVVDQSIASSDQFSAIIKSSDPRLAKDLSIGQFLAAFSVFRDVICSVYPERRIDLDAYLALIADLHLQYGRSLFYQYHKAFATKAAAVLFRSGLNLNWSTLDTEILIMLTQAVSCHLCGISGHLSAFCPSLPFKPGPPAAASPPSLLKIPSQDRHGRQVQVHNNMPICNNFNEGVCSFPKCAFLHICSFCRDAHPKSVCPRRTFPSRNRRGFRN